MTTMTYSNLIDIYTGLYTNKVNVLSFNSDNNTILFHKTTTAEILAISNTLKSVGHDNEIILIESLMFRIKFL
jgi:hypothetical protein